MKRTLKSRSVWAVHKDQVYYNKTDFEAAVEGFSKEKWKRFRAVDLDKALQFVKEGPGETTDRTPDDDNDWFELRRAENSEFDDALYVSVEGAKGKDSREKVRYGIEGWFGEGDKRNFSQLFPLYKPSVKRAEIVAVDKALNIVAQTEPPERAVVITIGSMYVPETLRKLEKSSAAAKPANAGLLKLLSKHISEQHGKRSIAFSRVTV